MPRRTGIKEKILVRFVIVILITVLIFEAIFAYGINTYYYSNIEHLITDKIQTSLDIYDTYLGYESLNYKAKFILENDAVPDYVEAQVIDNDGYIIESTAHYKADTPIGTEDYIRARKGEITIWRGFNRQTDEYVMAVSAPLFQSGEINGILRFVTSIEAVRQTISIFLFYALITGFIVLLIVVYLGSLMAERIIKPIYELKTVAGSIAIGDMSTRASHYELDEIGELAETINYMADEINKAEHLKHEFISSISHELRTPLTAIKGWSETILTGDLDNIEETTMGLEIITKESQRLSGLVENLLDFSKLEAERIELICDDFDLIALTERSFNQFSILLKKHKITTEIVAKKRNLNVHGDPNRIKQVLINLIDNAIKHTPEGGHIKCIILKQKNDKVSLSITDNGEGIPAQHLKRITDRFYKANSAVSGSGLGLAIVKRIIELHSGIIDITSEVNKGTSVTITLNQKKEHFNDVF